MTDDLVLFQDPESFENQAQDNGETFWWQSQLQELLGYSTASSFQKPISKAMAAMAALGISIPENFRPGKRIDAGGIAVDDTKLSRFACYLTAMNADPRKPEVAKAQAYFATLAEVARLYIMDGGENVERVVIRENYAYFQSAGYRGLYNRSLAQLKRMKEIPAARSLLDFMGKEELAANLFRITQTEAKIRNERVRGQANLEHAAETVGKEVRGAIQKIGGTMPEQLPTGRDIKTVKQDLNQANRELKKMGSMRSIPAAQEDSQGSDQDEEPDPLLD